MKKGVKNGIGKLWVFNGRRILFCKAVYFLLCFIVVMFSSTSTIPYVIPTILLSSTKVSFFLVNATSFACLLILLFSF